MLSIHPLAGERLTPQQWFHDRKVYLDALENQLRALLKATDMVVAQRKTLAESCAELSTSLRSLAAVELSPSLSGPLDGLSDIQLRIQELYQRQAQQDVLTLGIVIDEYIRLIGSIKQAFAQRQKAYHAWHAAESELVKRKGAQDKLLRQGRSQQDKISQVGAEVGDAERKVHQARLLFEDMGRLMRGELERFEREKVEDFKSGVETFLEGGVEAQKEVCLHCSWSAAEYALTCGNSLSKYGRRISCSSTPRTMSTHSASRVRPLVLWRHRRRRGRTRQFWRDRVRAGRQRAMTPM